MEQPPQNPFQSVPYYGAQMQPQHRLQPKSISVIAIFAIVIGSLSTLCGAGGLVFTAIAFSSSSSALGRAIGSQPTAMKIWDVIQPGVGLLLGIILLIGGIGGVQVREWARQLLIKWAPLEILFQIINCGLNIFFAVTVTVPQMQQQSQFRANGQNFITGYEVGQIIGIVLVTALLCVLPIFILSYWRRPYVIEAFASPPPSF